MRSSAQLRDRVAAACIQALALVFLSVAATEAAEPRGRALPGLEPFDREFAALIEKWGIPGGNLAVARDGRLLLSRGYGLADRSSATPVEPDTLFRLGSLSKPITAVAILLLVEDGRLGLDDRALTILGEIGPRPDRIHDPRVRAITVRHLLQHTAGFDRTKSGDVVFMPYAATAAARQSGVMPPTCPDVMRDVLEGELDFAPGAQHAYSNIGYCILGRIVERASGQPYEAFVRARVFAPAGIAGMRLARTMETAEKEATYYDYPGAPTMQAMPGFGLSRVARPYGAYSMEAMDSYGGWLGSATDFLRFMTAVDGQRGTPLLRQTTLKEVFARPPMMEGQAVYYGLGFHVRPVTGGRNWWHSGSQPGAVAFALRTAQGYAWVAAVNMRPDDRSEFWGELDRALWRAAKDVRRWPDGDLFAINRSD
jgi:CubicO group peptidase (beta-lactamase class C family)